MVTSLEIQGAVGAILLVWDLFFSSFLLGQRL